MAASDFSSILKRIFFVPALDFEVSRLLEKQLQAIHGTPTVLESWIVLLNGTDELLQLVISRHLHFCARIIAQSLDDKSTRKTKPSAKMSGS
jgi:hypothetical protein